MVAVGVVHVDDEGWPMPSRPLPGAVAQGWTAGRFASVVNDLAARDVRVELAWGVRVVAATATGELVAFVSGDELLVLLPPDLAAELIAVGDARGCHSPSSTPGWVAFEYPTSTTMHRFVTVAATHAARKQAGQ